MIYNFLVVRKRGRKPYGGSSAELLAHVIDAVEDEDAIESGRFRKVIADLIVSGPIASPSDAHHEVLGTVPDTIPAWSDSHARDVQIQLQGFLDAVAALADPKSHGGCVPELEIDSLKIGVMPVGSGIVLTVDS